ncbi:MAG: hypothetical protein GW823_08845 [Bacteroidetes bacterium]|nr:hypothetical protein [Bacteroidota bacterium]
MKNEIIKNLGNPKILENLYRSNKSTFQKDFNQIYTDIQHEPIAQIWNERLNFEDKTMVWGSKKERILIVFAILLAAFIAKIPHFFDVNPEFFYPRNIGFVVFPVLTAYFAWIRNLHLKQILSICVIFLISLFYINFLPDIPTSDTLILACIHLPLLLWSLYGFIFVGGKFSNFQQRLDFLRFNGDFLVMTTIILISGGILSAFTISLFELIDLKIVEFYMMNIGILGLSTAPIIGTYLVQTNPQIINKVSPIIAKLFTPLVLVMLTAFLGTILFTGKDPYNDRDFLILFNVLLIAVMALILFSLSESSKNDIGFWAIALLLGLAIVTVIINGIALSAIIFRISEWGFTPNRIAVLGSNLLILSNLLIVTFYLQKSVKNPSLFVLAEKSIASFLPIYSLWAAIVVFLFPFLFGFN